MTTSDDYLIVGLGNPGVKYEKTRHNLGFLVVAALADRWGVSFKRGWRLNGKVASCQRDEKKVHLLMPATYMNLSGLAVHKAMHYYKIALGRLLVVVDDVYIEFRTMRMRAEGSAGGHNGLRSVEKSLGTQSYARLRLGVGARQETRQLGKPLEEYVLTDFTAEEQHALPQVMEAGASVIEAWLKLGITAATQLASAYKGD